MPIHSQALRMSDCVDGIEKDLILRKPRSGCLEGRIALVPAACQRSTRSEERLEARTTMVQPVCDTAPRIPYFGMAGEPSTTRRVRAQTGELRQEGSPVRFLGVHPGPLLYTRVFLRLEPLGLELVAQAA